MSILKSCALALLLTGLVGCGGADTDAPAPDPAPSQPVTESTPVSSEPAAVPADAPIVDHSASSEPQTLPPEVESAHRSRIEDAWQRALAGSDPTNACAVLKSQLIVPGAAKAERALAACNVDVPVRYFQTQLARVQSGEATCEQVTMLMLSQLPALTMSLARVREMIGSDETSGSVSGGAVVDPANDSLRIVKDRLYESVVATCPGEAAQMMQ